MKTSSFHDNLLYSSNIHIDIVESKLLKKIYSQLREKLSILMINPQFGKLGSTL